MLFCCRMTNVGGTFDFHRHFFIFLFCDLIKSMRIYIKVSPRSSKNEVIKISEGEYKVKLAAAPIDNKANDMLIKVLAGYFGVGRSSLKIIGGKSAKVKIVEILL